MKSKIKKKMIILFKNKNRNKNTFFFLNDCSALKFMTIDFTKNLRYVNNWKLQSILSI